MRSPKLTGVIHDEWNGPTLLEKLAWAISPYTPGMYVRRWLHAYAILGSASAWRSVTRMWKERHQFDRAGLIILKLTYEPPLPYVMISTTYGRGWFYETYMNYKVDKPSFLNPSYYA